MKFEWPSIVYCYGFSLRKQALLRQFLPNITVRRLVSGQRPVKHACVLVWGAGEAGSDWPADTVIVRVEDGFLRSVGLGADLVRPISWVFDTRGIYFDASKASDLEWLLENAELSHDQIRRSEQLIRKVVDSRLTKYNVGSRTWIRPSNVDRVILVPGQVETDASIRLGAPGVSTNLGLVQAVRSANPDAYVLYKPHPDVMVGLRSAGRGESVSSEYCDEIVIDVSMAELVEAVDEVHVMTSLAGFEALLRERKVVCYGMPFYAGWGLTEDMTSCPRRTNKRSLAELAACALILYPTYISRSAAAIIEPEQALDELIAWRGSQLQSSAWWRELLRYFARIFLRRP